MESLIVLVIGYAVSVYGGFLLGRQKWTDQ